VRISILFWIALLAPVGHQGAGEFRAAAFSCDATPPLGHPLCGGWIKPLVSVDEPLLAKGVAISDGRTRFVICALDWCLLQTGAYDLFRRKIAAAAGIPESQVAVQTVHQHNAPIADIEAQRLLTGQPSPPAHLDLDFMEKVTDRVAASVREALDRLRPLTHVGWGKAKVEKFASNRRVMGKDGKIRVRWSAVKDPELQAAPEGRIDPWLRTVTLFDGDRALARLHYYASHPQSYYGDGKATPDAPGLARERLEREEGVPQIYFTGCAGNVTAGKYNQGTAEDRVRLTDRLYAGMKGAVAATQKAPVGEISWKSVEVNFSPRAEPEFSEERQRKMLANAEADAGNRIRAALNLAWISRLQARPGVDTSRVRIGPVFILHLPGEAFVEYQLYAQTVRPADFVAVAAYGESGPGYVCTDRALSEGGYEPGMSRVGPPSETRLRAAIAELLRLEGEPRKAPFYPDKRRLLALLDAEGREHPVRNAEEWARRREHILSNFQEATGPLPGKERRVPLDVQVSETADLPRAIRKKLTYASEPGNRVGAYLFLPKGSSGRVPAVLCPHPTHQRGKDVAAGLLDRKDPKTQLYAGGAYAVELAERGYVTLAPDYPHLGEHRTDPQTLGYASTTMKAIWDNIRGVDLLQSLPEVDPERIASIGYSLGGHNTMYTAVFEPRIRAAISASGFDTAAHYHRHLGSIRPWASKYYMPRIETVYHLDPDLLPFDFHEIVAALAPRPFLTVSPLEDSNFDVEGVREVMKAAQPVYELLGAADGLRAIYPEGGHGFPDAAREAAYAWLDRWLRKK